MQLLNLHVGHHKIIIWLNMVIIHELNNSLAVLSSSTLYLPYILLKSS